MNVFLCLVFGLLRALVFGACRRWKVVARAAGVLALVLAVSAIHTLAQTTPVVVQQTVSCATSTDGSVVGVQNPLNPAVVAAQYTGTLPAGNYYTQIGWYDAAAHVTLVAPEVQTQLTGAGALQVNLPTSGKPAAAVGMNVYIGASSGTETLQGQTTGAATFTQSAPLATGIGVPATNTTVCAIVANDAGWPTGTGYNVSMVTPSGAIMPGYPMQWQLLGPGTTLNLGQGLPLYSGIVTYPIPLLARPYNHASQSVSGPLNMTFYPITQVLKLGVGTSLPAWPIDVENGPINTNGGYIFNGGVGVTTGDCLEAGTDPYLTFIPTTAQCLTTATAKYQTIENAGSALPQEPNLNLVHDLVGVDNPTNHSTDVGLSPVGTAGTYPYPTSITVDAYGRTTGITTGSATAACTTYASTSAAGCSITADGKILEWVNGPTEISNFSGNVTVTLPVTLPNGCYSAQFSTFTFATPSGNGASYANYEESCSTTSITFWMDVATDSGGSGANRYTVVQVIGH